MSATQPNLGQAALKRRSVGKLVFYPGATPTVGYDAGNVVKWSHNDKRDRAQSMSNDLAAAAAVTVREDVHTLSYGYKFTVDEWTDFLRMLVANNLTAPAADSQSSATAATVSITAPLAGRTYDLGKRDVTITSVIVTTGSVALVAGTDYAVDLASGQITFFATQTTTVVTFNAAALARRKFTAGGANPTVYGTFLFFEYDQMSSSARAEHSFSGNVTVASQTGETEKDFRDAALEVTCWGVPVIRER